MTLAIIGLGIGIYIKSKKKCPECSSESGGEDSNTRDDDGGKNINYSCENYIPMFACGGSPDVFTAINTEDVRIDGKIGKYYTDEQKCLVQ